MTTDYETYAKRVKSLFETFIVRSLNTISIINTLPSNEKVSSESYKPSGARGVVYNLLIREFSARLTGLCEYKPEPSRQFRLTIEIELNRVLNEILRTDPYLRYYVKNSAFYCNDVNNSEERINSGRLYVLWSIQFTTSAKIINLDFNSWCNIQEAGEEWIKLGHDPNG